MKSYLKSITKTLYEKVQRVVEDEYIQPITESEVYSIINRKRKRSLHIKGDKQAAYYQQKEDKLSIIQNIERLGLVSPQRQFMLIGDNYNVQVINYRLRQLKTKIDAVKEYMLDNYEPNRESIQQALNHLEDAKNLQKTKYKAEILRQKLSKLVETVARTKKITKLNIKIKNIKESLKILEKVPPLKKMSCFELKSINLQQINKFKKSLKVLYPTSESQNLQCIEHIEGFIDRAVGEHLRGVIDRIKQSLVSKFQSIKYEKTLKDFLIVRSSIQYQKLIIRLIETQIRDNISNNNNETRMKSQKDNRESLQSNRDGSLMMDLSHYSNEMHGLCQKYIAILINLSMLLRFHRSRNCVVDKSELDELIRPRNLSNVSDASEKQQENINTSKVTDISNTDNNSIKSNKLNNPVLNLQSETSIHINTKQVKFLTCTLMDQSLKQHVQQILINQSLLNQQIFELLSLINNFFQIAFSFTSHIFTETQSTIKQFLLRKCYKLHQKGVNDLTQALRKQDELQWNRLPVPDNYRYKSLQKNLQKIKRLHLIQKVPLLYSSNFKFLNINDQEEQQSSESFQLSLAQNREQTFQLNEVDFPYDKLQKVLTIETNDSQLPEHEDPVVVICKSSLVVLAYFEKFMQMYCYFPIQQIREDILNKMTFYIDYYVYYLFETFLSEMYKRFFQDEQQTIQENYHHVRVKSLYREVYRFVKEFKLKQNTNSIGKIINGNDSSERRNNETIENHKYKTRGFSFVKLQISQSQISQQNAVKARAIATDSIKYILAYFSHILTHLQKYTETEIETNDNSNTLLKYIKRLAVYKVLQQQLSDLLLTDIVPASTKIDFVVPIIKKIKWNELQNTKQITEYGQMIMKNIKEVYEKLKSGSKGSMPYYIVDRIFAFYWKTQLTFITKIFLEEHIAQKQKGGKTSKLAFEKLVDVLYEEIYEIVGGSGKSRQVIESSKSIGSTNYGEVRQQMFKSSYLKIKSIFPILLERQWQKSKQMIGQLFVRFEFIFKISFAIMRASESCSGLSPGQLQERQREIEQFISQKVVA